MKKLVFFCLVCVLALSFSIPSAAAAKAPTPFTAAIQVWAVAPGDVVRDGVRTRTTGEKINGVVFASSQWGDLLGASITVTHNSNTLIDAAGNILDGHAHATFEIVHAGGPVVGTIVGNYRSKISGNISGMPGTSFTDVGGWNLVKATGIYAGMQSHGDWQASLAFDPAWGTFVGVAQLSGRYH